MERPTVTMGTALHHLSSAELGKLPRLELARRTFVSTSDIAAAVKRGQPAIWATVTNFRETPLLLPTPQHVIDVVLPGKVLRTPPETPLLPLGTEDPAVIQGMPATFPTLLCYSHATSQHGYWSLPPQQRGRLDVVCANSPDGIAGQGIFGTGSLRRYFHNPTVA